MHGSKVNTHECILCLALLGIFALVVRVIDWFMNASCRPEWDGHRAVKSLVLLSPPSFDAMRKGLDAEKVALHHTCVPTPRINLLFTLYSGHEAHLPRELYSVAAGLTLFGCVLQVASNWRMSTSRLGQASYFVLRARFFVKFFSNLFLFSGGAADEEWLQVPCC